MAIILLLKHQPSDFELSLPESSTEHSINLPLHTIRPLMEEKIFVCIYFEFLSSLLWLMCLLFLFISFPFSPSSSHPHLSLRDCHCADGGNAEASLSSCGELYRVHWGAADPLCQRRPVGPAAGLPPWCEARPEQLRPRRVLAKYDLPLRRVDEEGEAGEEEEVKAVKKEREREGGSGERSIRDEVWYIILSNQQSGRWIDRGEEPVSWRRKRRLELIISMPSLLYCFSLFYFCS